MNAHRRLLVVEIACWMLGLAGLGVWGVFQIGVASSARDNLERFAALKSAAPQPGTPDQSLWSLHRIAAWRKALSDPSPAPLAVLRIPKIHLEAAVLPGTDDRTLDRAVGHIEGTAKPGTDGNTGIAGHRDGFFRGLKDIVEGDVIELDTIDGKDSYRVERTWVVDPDDVSVLDRYAGARAHAGHLLSLLLRRLRAPAIHRPCSASGRERGVLTRRFIWISGSSFIS